MAKAVVEWYAAQRYQVCPRARKLEFIDNIERREMPANQAAARFIRRGIYLIAAGGDHVTVPQLMAAEFMDTARSRGIFSPRPFNTAKRLADAIHGILYHYDFDWGKTHEVHAPQVVQFELTSEIDFRVHRPVFLRNRAGDWFLLYPKVTAEWKNDYELRAWREFQLLSEMAALLRFSDGGTIQGTLLLPVSLNSATVGEPVLVPYDEAAVRDWLQQTESQEQRIFDDHVAASLAAGDPQFVRYAGNQFFPQYRMNCDKPYPCEFVPVCWGDLSTGADPLEDARYRRRVVEG